MSNEKKINIEVIGFGIISFLMTIVLFIKNGLSASDLIYYWRNTAYWCRGYSLEWIEKNEHWIESIGEMQDIGIFSYARAISNLIIPGFLPWRVLEVYHYALLTVIVVLLGIEIRKWLEEKDLASQKLAVAFTVCFLIMPWYWPDYLRAANIGGMLALMVILAAFYIESHENIAALLIAISLIKPQVGGIFLIALF